MKILARTLTRKKVLNLGLHKLATITADMLSEYRYIGEWAFRNCNKLTSIEIPNSITNIKEYAFEGCRLLTSITLPNSIKKIGCGAFHDCSNLISINIPNKVKIISSASFAYCYNLKSIKISSSVTSIEDSAFAGCTNLFSIEIPNSVTSIGNRVFEDCYNLTSVVLSNSIKEIGEEAFHRDYSIHIPERYDNKGRLVAYKGFCKNMKCHDFKYKKGQTYETSKAKLCECGFHACLNPLDIFNYYYGEINKDIVIHKVYLEEVSNEENEDSKVVAKKITIGKRLTIEDINRIIKENNNHVFNRY